MPTRRTLPKFIMRAWMRAAPLNSQPPTIAVENRVHVGAEPLSAADRDVQFHWLLMACRTLSFGFITRPYRKPRNADVPSMRVLVAGVDHEARDSRRRSSICSAW